MWVLLASSHFLKKLIVSSSATETSRVWLLRESHGIALVEKWLQCGEGAEYADRVKVFSVYSKLEKEAKQRAAKEFLESNFNTTPNLEGQECKMLVCGASDFGTGVTFAGLRHVFLNATNVFYNLLQQMGRATRLCKHADLRPEKRNVQFHLPLPVFTLGWDAGGEGAASLMKPFGSVKIGMDNFQSLYAKESGKKEISAQLFVPGFVEDVFKDLQRSRTQFMNGMLQFQKVAMDTAYYAKVTAGTSDPWTLPNDANVAKIPTASALEKRGREMLKAAVVATALPYSSTGRRARVAGPTFYQDGQRQIEALSKEHAELNALAILEATPVGRMNSESQKKAGFRRLMRKEKEEAAEREAERAKKTEMGYVLNPDTGKLVKKLKKKPRPRPPPRRASPTRAVRRPAMAAPSPLLFRVFPLH